MKTILKEYLSAAGVKYSDLAADCAFYSNPNRNNLLGLKQMLSAYHLDMEGGRIPDGQTDHLTFPCIVRVNGKFVVATQCDDSGLTYLNDGKEVLLKREEIVNQWDGYTLLLPDPKQFSNAYETNYKSNLQKQRMEKLPWWGLAVVGAGILAWGHVWDSTFSMVLAILSVLGLALSCFLTEKEVKGSSLVGDQLCKWLGESKCGSHNRASILAGDLTLSEVGLGYFASQILTLSLWGESLMTIAAISILGCLFCPWSILTQWKTKQWCVLCLGVLAVLLAQGGISIYALDMAEIQTDLFTKTGVILFIILGIVIAHLVVRGLHEKKKAQEKDWLFQAFRKKRYTWENEWANSPVPSIEERDIAYSTGKKDAEAPHVLTVVTSNNCPHCKAMEPRVKDLGIALKERLRIDYVVLSDMKDEQKHEFIQRTGINATPTLLVDGHLLPRGYEVEDLQLLLH